MQKSAIDWGVGQLWTWNVVTGCPRNCSVNGKRAIKAVSNCQIFQLGVYKRCPVKVEKNNTCNAKKRCKIVL
jgi:hypothetical protein